jgi:hypothetical protein
MEENTSKKIGSASKYLAEGKNVNLLYSYWSIKE